MVKRLVYMFLALCLCSCELIREDERLLPLPWQAGATGSTHVLIEFTGFRCVNCPTAAEAAEELHQTYGDRLIVVAMHPASNPFTQGVAQFDYTCEAADTYYRQMGGTATTPFPTGNIDFVAGSSGYFSDWQEWAALLAKRMSDSTDVQLHAEATYDADTRRIHVRTTCRADIEKDIRLMMWLVEDSVSGAQAMPDGSVNQAYMHRHVLRGVAATTEGEQLHLLAVSASHSATMQLPEGCDPKRCSMVVLAADPKDGRIIQATQTNL